MKLELTTATPADEAERPASGVKAGGKVTFDRPRRSELAGSRFLGSINDGFNNVFVWGSNDGEEWRRYSRGE